MIMLTMRFYEREYCEKQQSWFEQFKYGFNAMRSFGKQHHGKYKVGNLKMGS